MTPKINHSPLATPSFLLMAALVFNFSQTSFSQTFLSNNGGLISIKPGTFMSVHDDVINLNDGEFYNQDTIFLFGDWTNDAGNPSFFVPGEGTVIMLGDEQHINGTDVTVFNNLELRATNIKYADLDVVVENELILNDREFNCDTNTVFVTNPDPAIVTSDGGFVSSLSDGGLSREMNTNADYFFPVGSSLGTVRYRPVFLEPNFPNGNTFKVRFANTDATLEGFDRELREPNICEVNPEYYHRIYHTSGIDPVDVKLYYDAGADLPFENMVHWQNIPQWEDVGTVTDGFDATIGLNYKELTGWNDFLLPSFAFSELAPVLDLVQEDTVCEGDDVTFITNTGWDDYEIYVNGELVLSSSDSITAVPGVEPGDLVYIIAYNSDCETISTIFTPGFLPRPAINAGNDTVIWEGSSAQLHGEGAITFDWFPTDGLSCSDCPDPIATPDTTTTYILTTTNDEGCVNHDSVTVVVAEITNPDDVLITPNAITPNNDGVNDVWNIQGIELLEGHEVIIFNRWGDILYEQSPYTEPWDGTYNGKPVPEATYYYVINLPSHNTVRNGPLTVLR